MWRVFCLNNKISNLIFITSDPGLSWRESLMGTLPKSDLTVPEEQGIDEIQARAAWVVMICAAGVLIILAATFFSG